MDAPTDSSVLDDDPLSFTIKKEIKHEKEQEEYLFVPFSTTDDELIISKQSVDAPSGNSFLDEDPLSFTIKKEIKEEKEQTEYLFESKQRVDLVRLKEEPLDVINGDIEKDPLAIEETDSVKSENLKVKNERDISLKNGYLSLSREGIAFCTGLSERLGQIAAQCNADQAHGGGANIDESRFQDAKEILTLEVRKLVTPSKLLVRSSSAVNSMNSSSAEFQIHLANCITLLRRLTELSNKMAEHTSFPLHTCNLVVKVQDVVAVFKDLLATEGQEALLTRQAEVLASVLAILLRSLRVFTP